jgi:ribosomal protein L40E
MEFLRRKGRKDAAGAAARPASAAPRPAMPEEVIAQDHVLRLVFSAKSSEGVRLGAGPEVLGELPSMVSPQAISPIEVVPPREMDTGEASPVITHAEEASAWLRAHGQASPVTRHALYVLETLDAIDPAYETFACAMLEGTVDPAGFPDFSAIVGGVAAHWDEVTGDLIVRAVLGWGGRGARGDTDRTATRILASLFRNIVASGGVIGLAESARPLSAGTTGAMVCQHCGFAAAGLRAMYCPKCGMRMLRG